MITTILTKFGLPALILSVGFGAGMVTSKKLEKPVKVPEYKCPDCNCPPAVELNKKGGQFHLHNTLSNVTIKIEAKDSVLIKQLLRQAK
jgi:hypothetical protein